MTATTNVAVDSKTDRTKKVSIVSNVSNLSNVYNVSNVSNVYNVSNVSNDSQFDNVESKTGMTELYHNGNESRIHFTHVHNNLKIALSVENFHLIKKKII